MKNKELLAKLTQVASRNLSKVFFSLFVMVLLESICSGFVIACALVLSHGDGSSIVLAAACCALMVTGIFIWFLLLSGFAFMLLRMERSEFVTLGFLFHGFRKFKFFYPAALLCTALSGLCAAFLAALFYYARSFFPSLIDHFQKALGDNALLYISATLSVILMVVVVLPQVFIVYIRSDNHDKNVFKSAFLSASLFYKNFFRFVGFVFSAGGRNLILAIVYFAVTMTLSSGERGTLVQVLSFVFDFLYFINIYRAFSLMCLAIPVFYDDLVQPKIEIVIQDGGKC